MKEFHFIKRLDKSAYILIKRTNNKRIMYLLSPLLHTNGKINQPFSPFLHSYASITQNPFFFSTISLKYLQHCPFIGVKQRRTEFHRFFSKVVYQRLGHAFSGVEPFVAIKRSLFRFCFLQVEFFFGRKDEICL